MTAAKERVERLLCHYLHNAYTAAGLRWDGGNAAEVASIVDGIVELVDDAIREHAENAPHLYADGSS